VLSRSPERLTEADREMLRQMGIAWNDPMLEEYVLTLLPAPAVRWRKFCGLHIGGSAAGFRLRSATMDATRFLPNSQTYFTLGETTTSALSFVRREWAR